MCRAEALDAPILQLAALPVQQGAFLGGDPVRRAQTLLALYSAGLRGRSRDLGGVCRTTGIADGRRCPSVGGGISHARARKKMKRGSITALNELVAAISMALDDSRGISQASFIFPSFSAGAGKFGGGMSGNEGEGGRETVLVAVRTACQIAVLAASPPPEMPTGSSAPSGSDRPSCWRMELEAVCRPSEDFLTHVCWNPFLYGHLAYVRQDGSVWVRDKTGLRPQA